MNRAHSPEVFNRLDQAYSYWEEEMWRLQLQSHKSSLLGYKLDITETGYPTVGYEKTPSLLLEASTRDDLSYLLPTFRQHGISEAQLSKERTEVEVASGNPSAEFKASARWQEFHFPHNLGKWNASSRRIYIIPQDLVLMLQATSLKGRTYRDLRYPFPSFGLALETPIVAEGKELDFFLLCGDSIPEAWYGFSNKLRSWKPVDVSLRQKINKAVQTKNQHRFQSLAYKQMLKVGRFTDLWQSGFWPEESGEYLDVDIEDDLRQASKQETRAVELDWTDKMFRVVFGFAFYLQALHESQKDLVQRVPNKNASVSRSTLGGKGICSTAEVFKVQSIFALTTEERVGFTNYFSGKGGWEVNTHFREGHWRRPPGEACNPLAQKTVWVRPTMVRRDRLPANTLPAGRGVVVS